MRLLIVLAIAISVSSTSRGGDALDVIVVDTEGGKAVLVKTPEGGRMLVDAGYPRDDDRDTNRIVAAARTAGIDEFDFIVATHYDADHAGNVARVDGRIPARAFVDHGELIAGCTHDEHYKSYLEAIRGRPRLSVRPGDSIPLAGLRITVVSAGGAVLEDPLAGAGKPDALCAAESKAGDAYDNAGSVGLLFEFGKFRMLDLADLLARQEHQLMCPENRIGAVDLFMVSHHGFQVSNSALLIHALRPRVAIMNNGPSKGGDPQVFDTLRTSPGFQDLWQLHYAPRAEERNAPEEMIANPRKDCEAKPISVRAYRDGSFTVTNARNDYSKTYPPK